ncbi:MAG TPA: hypothetical protein VNT99_07955 [Methylomirabilota bacterium]|nr:hypothetical protein [Methylomirabilota bacterium]
MNARGLLGAMFVTTFLGTAGGQAADGLSSAPPTNAAATNQVAVAPMPLTNRAMLVISRLRGVELTQVKLRPSTRASGPFEIDLTDAKDCRKEAEELSKELGAEAVVVFDHVSADGVTRTNWSFRSGTGKQVTAPAAPTGLGPHGKRIYVWPQSSARPSPPAGTRVRTRAE